MLTPYEKAKLSEIYGSAIAEVYDYVLEQEKNRHGAGTPKAADVKVQVQDKYSAAERKCQDGVSKEKVKV